MPFYLVDTELTKEIGVTTYLKSNLVSTTIRKEEAALFPINRAEQIEDYDNAIKKVSAKADLLINRYKKRLKEAYKKARREYRFCSQCRRRMNEGYCIDNGMFYYCSDECLQMVMTMDEYLELYDDGEGTSYWTEWE